MGHIVDYRGDSLLHYYLCSTREEVGKISGSIADESFREPGVVVSTSLFDKLSTAMAVEGLGKETTALLSLATAYYIADIDSFERPILEETINEIIEKNKYISIESLSDDKILLAERSEIVKPIITGWAKYLITYYGYEKYKRLYNMATNKYLFNKSFKSIYGKTVGEIEREWIQNIKIYKPIPSRLSNTTYNRSTPNTGVKVMPLCHYKPIDREYFPEMPGINLAGIETEHFRIFYRKNRNKRISYLCGYCEKTFNKLSNYFKKEISFWIIINYFSRDDLVKIYGEHGKYFYPSSGGNTILLIRENDALYENDPEFDNRIVLHELAHIFTDNVAGPPKGRYPVWLYEGIARYIEETEYPRSKLPINELYNLDEMGDEYSINIELDKSKAYSTGSAFIAYLIDSYGKEKFIAFIERLNNEPFEKALLLCYSKNIKALEKEWRNKKP